MYRYTQVGCEFLLLQLTSHIEKNTPLISQLLEESIRTSFQTSLDPEPSFPCMRKGPAACAYSSYQRLQSRKRNQIKQYSFQNSFLLLQPSLYCFSRHHRSWSLFIPDGSGRRITDLGACTSAPSQLKPAPSSHGSSSTARLTVTVTSHWSSQPSPHWCI